MCAGGERARAAWELAETSLRSRTDSLTGLWNRRHFDEQLERVLAETDRFGGSCALVICDIDHFKKVNDTYGHDAGDAVLVQVAEALREAVRTVDVSARIGGEELAVILPQTSLDGAVELADRLRQRIESLAVPHDGVTLRVTVSMGVATYRVGGRGRRSCSSGRTKSCTWRRTPDGIGWRRRPSDSGFCMRMTMKDGEW